MAEYSDLLKTSILGIQTPYVTGYTYFANGGTVLDDLNADIYLKYATKQIDSLTFNRIRGIGFDNLTNFQKEVITCVVSALAEFYYQNEDFLSTYLKSYSINGVSVDYSNTQNIRVVRGVAIPKELYNYLEQSGLCCTNVRF